MRAVTGRSGLEQTVPGCNVPVPRYNIFFDGSSSFTRCKTFFVWNVMFLNEKSESPAVIDSSGRGVLFQVATYVFRDMSHSPTAEMDKVASEHKYFEIKLLPNGRSGLPAVIGRSERGVLFQVENQIVRYILHFSTAAAVR